MSRMSTTVTFVPGRRGMRKAQGLRGLGDDVAPFPNTPAAREAWFNALPPAEQSTFIAQTQALFRSLPMPLQQALTRYMISIGEKVPFASGIDGYGPVAGLGQWAEIASAISSMANIGASLYNTHATNSLTQELQSNALSTNASIAAARDQAAAQAAQIIADAQKATAAQAAQAFTLQSQAQSVTTTSTVKTLAIAGSAVAALGIVAYVILKKK